MKPSYTEDAVLQSLIDTLDKLNEERALRIKLEGKIARRRVELAKLHEARAYERETENILVDALAREAAGLHGAAAKALETYKKRLGPRD